MNYRVISGILALLILLLAFPGVVSASDLHVSADLSVVDEDLTVTALTINNGSSAGHNVISANEPNTLRATVANIEELSAGAFNVTIVIGSYTQTVRVASLAANTTTTVDFTYTPTMTGAISVAITADSGTEIAESNETNNVFSQASAVYYNGYKGKRYTAGNDFTTKNSYTGRVGVVYSTGNATYAGAGWYPSYSASFTAAPSSANLSIPGTATILSARLYQATNWEQSPGETPVWTTVQFNGGTVTPSATYTDRKGYGTYNYPSSVYLYDVTSTFNKAGTNTWNLVNGTGNNQGLYPAYMVVVYQDAATETEKTISINDECDLLYSKASYNTNDAETTAYAPFTGVNITGMGSAKAIAFVAAVNEIGDSRFFFNNVSYGDFFVDAAKSTSNTVSIKEYPLTNVASGANEAKMQSSSVNADGDNMQVQNLILVIEKAGATGVLPSKIGITSNGVWYLDNSGNGAWGAGDSVYSFGGAPGYTSALGDWNFTGKTDIGVTNGQQWYLDWNGNGAFDSGVDKAYSFGAPGWLNVTGDWNHDGKTDIGVTNGQQWYLDMNNNGVFDSGIDKVYSFGAPGWTPIVGDWNATGNAYIGVTNGQQWYLDWNGNGAWDGADKAYSFGATGWTPVLGDWNYDGKTDIGITNGQQWYLDMNNNGVFDSGVDKVYSFGAPGWTPIVGDWNATGNTYIGVTNGQQWYLDWNGNGAWDGADKAYSFGAPGWTPIIGRWV